MNSTYQYNSVKQDMLRIISRVFFPVAVAGVIAGILLGKYIFG